MFIDKNSLKVKVQGANDSTYINLGDYDGNGTSLITEARYGYNKIWGKDSGRKLNGEMTGSLVGIFPKIIVNFKKLSKTELQLIAPILDTARQTLQYYDANKKNTVTMTTYTGDWEVVNKSIIDSHHKNEPFEISFISIKKRS